MSTLKMKNPFKSTTMTREKLLERAEGLFKILKCVSHEESLWGKGVARLLEEEDLLGRVGLDCLEEGGRGLGEEHPLASAGRHLLAVRGGRGLVLLDGQPGGIRVGGAVRRGGGVRASSATSRAARTTAAMARDKGSTGI